MKQVGNVNRTKELAQELAKKILNNEIQEHATVVALTGDLGAGKTTFTQLFAKMLGIKEKITSPTFVIFKKFQIPKSLPADATHQALQAGKLQTNSKFQIQKFKNLIHIDAYRLDSHKELLDLGWQELLDNPENIILVEWAEKIEKILPRCYYLAKFEHLDKEKRSIDISLIK